MVYNGKPKQNTPFIYILPFVLEVLDFGLSWFSSTKFYPDIFHSPLTLYNCPVVNNWRNNCANLHWENIKEWE